MIEKGVKNVINQGLNVPKNVIDQGVNVPKKNPFNCEYCGWDSDPKEVKREKNNFICDSCGFESPLPAPVAESVVVIEDDDVPLSNLNNKKLPKIQRLQMKAKTGGKQIIKKIVQTVNTNKINILNLNKQSNNIHNLNRQGNNIYNKQSNNVYNLNKQSNNVYNLNKQSNTVYNLNKQSNSPADLLNSLFPLRATAPKQKPKQGKVNATFKEEPKKNDDSICIIEDDDEENNIPSEKKAEVNGTKMDRKADVENGSSIKKVDDGEKEKNVAVKSEKGLEDVQRTWQPVEDESFPAGWKCKQANAWGRRIKYRSPDGNEFPTRKAAMNSMGKGEDDSTEDLEKASKKGKDLGDKEAALDKKKASRKLKPQKGTSSLVTLKKYELKSTSENDNTSDSSRRTSTRLSAKKALSSIRKTAKENLEDEDVVDIVSKRSSKRISFDSDEISIVKEVTVESPKRTKKGKKSSKTKSRRNSTGTTDTNSSRRTSNRRHSAGDLENSPRRVSQKSSRRVSFEGDEISIVEEVNVESPKKPVKNGKKSEKKGNLKKKLLEKKKKTAVEKENLRNTPRRLSKKQEEELSSKDDLDNIYDDISVVEEVVPKSPTPIKNKKARKGKKGKQSSKNLERKVTEKKPTENSTATRSSSRVVKSKNISYTFSSDEDSEEE